MAIAALEALDTIKEAGVDKEEWLRQPERIAGSLEMIPNY